MVALIHGGNEDSSVVKCTAFKISTVNGVHKLAVRNAENGIVIS